MALAETLGKFEHEVLELTPDELSRWFAYFKIKNKKQEQQRQKSKRSRRRR